LQAGRDPLGTVGEVAPDVLEAFEVTEPVAILEFDLDQILDREPKPTQWKPTSRYPSCDLDLSFVVPDDIPAERVEKAVRQGAGSLLVDVDLFDIYRGERAAQGSRSLAYRVRLQASDRNLTDADIADVRRSVEAAATKLGAILRT
jgi:phenylalanyl-tRNA synthetase beta chain